MTRKQVSTLLAVAALASLGASLLAQQPSEQKMKPEETEIWQPVPPVVTPGKDAGAAPSDAIALFDGKGLDEWVNVSDQQPAKWDLVDGLMRVNKSGGSIETKRKFKNYQLHIEFRIPESITGSGQARGNSGVFLAGTGPGDSGYELQVLDSYQNSTYVNGMAGSIYKQSIPLANAAREMGMPLYGCVTPNGYSWQSDTWVSTNALVNRMNFALSLAANRFPGISVTWDTTPDSCGAVSILAASPGGPSPQA